MPPGFSPSRWTSAAPSRNTGAVGAAVGFGNVRIAVVLSPANYLVLRIIKPIAGVKDAAERARNEGDPDPNGGAGAPGRRPAHCNPRGE